jgi:hypothetical protein
MVVYMSRIIRLVSPATGETNSDYILNKFDDDIILDPFTEIALLNCTIPLQGLNKLVVDSINGSFRVKHDPSRNFQTLTLTSGSYDNVKDLANEIYNVLMRSIPFSTSTTGLQYLVQVNNGVLDIIFTRHNNDLVDGELDERFAYYAVNMDWNDVAEEWQTTVHSPTVSAGENFVVAAQNPFTKGSGFVQANILQSGGGSGSYGDVFIGLVPESYDFFETNIIDISDPTQVAFGLSVQDPGVITLYKPDGTSGAFTATANPDDILKIEINNSNNTASYILVRNGVAHETYTYEFTNAEREQEFYAYLGLGPDVESVANSFIYTPSRGSSLRLHTVEIDFPNDYAFSFFGYPEREMKATTIDGVGHLKAKGAPKNSEDIPAIMVELSNLKLEGYDGKQQPDGGLGRRKNILAVIPGVERSIKEFTYEPQVPTYVGLRNRDTLNLRELEVRFTLEDDTYLEFLNRASVTLAIKGSS